MNERENRENRENEQPRDHSALNCDRPYFEFVDEDEVDVEAPAEEVPTTE